MTPRQLALLTYIDGYTRARGCPPSLEEMAAGIGVASKSSVHRLLSALWRQGRIGCQRGTSRGVTVLPESTAEALRELVLRLAREEGAHRAAAALLDLAASLVPA